MIEDNSFADLLYYIDLLTARQKVFLVFQEIKHVCKKNSTLINVTQDFFSFKNEGERGRRVPFLVQFRCSHFGSIFSIVNRVDKIGQHHNLVLGLRRHHTLPYSEKN